LSLLPFFPLWALRRVEILHSVPSKDPGFFEPRLIGLTRAIVPLRLRSHLFIGGYLHDELHSLRELPLAIKEADEFRAGSRLLELLHPHLDIRLVLWSAVRHE